MSAALEYFCGEELSANVFLDKYALRDKDDVVVEQTPDDMHRRMAREIARIEKGKFKQPYSEEFIYSLFKDFEHIIPQGSVMYGLGNHQYVSLSNCFLSSCPTDSYGGIHKSDEELTQISKRRGGVGMDVSHIRPDDMPTSNAARKATGVVSFCERFSNSIREVGQNGRRGALMLTLSVHHPQVLDFAKMKLDPTKVTGANVSIRLTNAFMEAVDKDETYIQQWPVESLNPKIRREVYAREVWKEIIRCAWLRAEPGLLFWNKITSECPADCYAEFGFKTVSTNPCCFSIDSNIWTITKNGIKEIKQITSDDEVWVDDLQKWERASGYFSSGLADVYSVKFSCGEELLVTNNHKFMVTKSKRDGTGVKYLPGELVKLQDLKLGDKILLHINEVIDFKFGDLGNYNEGVILGWLAGDGCLCFSSEKDSYPSVILDFWEKELDTADLALEAINSFGYNLTLTSCKENNKKRIKTTKFTEYFTEKYNANIWLFKSKEEVNPHLFKMSKDCVRGYINAYFSADGAVACNQTSKEYNIQVACVNKNHLQQIKQLLLLFGVKSSLGLMRKAGTATFSNGKLCKTLDCWRLTISGVDNIRKFATQFSFLCKHKQIKLQEIVNTNVSRRAKCKTFSTITSIDYVGKQEVGCFQVQDAQRFTANGLVSGNSELNLCEYDTCRLLLLNLYGYVTNPFTKTAKFDFKKFYEHAQIAQRLMDDIIDLELECIDRILAKVKSDPEPENVKLRELDLWSNIRRKCSDGRRTGTGITALGDVFAALGIKYGSDDSIEVADIIYRTLKFGCYKSSVDMAEEIGPFPIWDASLEVECPFLNRIKDEHLVELDVDGKDIFEKMQKVGRRNIALLTTAPAGSVSIVAGPRPYFGTTSGIEPLFTDKPYTRRKKITPGMTAKVDFVDELGDKWTHFEVFHSKIKAWMEITGETDWTKSPYHGCTANDLDWPQRVKLQAVITRHLDHSCSSTLNLPNDVTEEKVAEIYETAWRSGCKGITVYRDGCRSGVLVKNEPAKEEVKIKKFNAPKRPNTLPCDIHHISVKKQPFVVVVGLLENDPYEVFTFSNENGVVGKENKQGEIVKVKRGEYELCSMDGVNIIGDSLSSVLTDAEQALTRMVSTALRHGTDIGFIVQQLEKTKGDLHSFSRALARALKKYIADGVKVSGEKCDTCQTESLVRQEGCVSCKNCGWSKC